MSTACIDVSALYTPRTPDRPITEQDVIINMRERAEKDPSTLSFFVRALLDHVCRNVDSGDFRVPSDIAEALVEFRGVRLSDDTRPIVFDLGRIGVRALTSSWAKAMFPKAGHEVIATMAEATRGGRIHTLLIYV